MTERPKQKEKAPDPRRLWCGVISSIIPELKPEEIEYVEKVIKRVKRERKEDGEQALAE